MILSNLSIPLVGLADVTVMGQLSDPRYIGAITVGAALFSATYWLFGFLRMGTTGLVAQSFGADQWGEIARTYLRSITIAICLGLLLVAFKKPLEHGLFEIFNASDGVEAMAREYFSIRIFSAPAVLISLTSIGVLFGLQKMKATLFLTIFLNLTNLILDIVLVLVFELGVKGVAMGTLISEWMGAMLGFYLVSREIRKNLSHRIVLKSLFEREEFARFFDISGNLILRTFIVQVPFFVGTVLATEMGDELLAAHGILMQLYFIMTYVLDGLAHTAESLSGYYFGAKAKKEFQQACYYSGFWTAVLASMIALIYFIFSSEFIGLMTQSKQVQIAAQQFVPWIAISPILCAGAFMLDGVFIGITQIKQMRNSMFFAGICWGLTLLLSYSSLGYHAIWLAMSTFMFCRTLFLGYYLIRVFQTIYNWPKPRDPGDSNQTIPLDN